MAGGEVEGAAAPEASRETDAQLGVVALLAGARSGSTFAMELLATSDRLAFDRVFPYEVRHLTYAARVARLYAPRDHSPMLAASKVTKVWRKLRAKLDRRLDPTDVRSVRSEVVPEPWDREGPSGNLVQPTGENDQLWVQVLAATWRPVGDRIRDAWRERAGVEPVAYAEKTPLWVVEAARAILPLRVLHVVRDPRDVWLSVRAFDRKRGYYGFGRRPGQSEESYLEEFIARRRRLLQLVPTDTRGTSHLVLRYEDMVSDTTAAAALISEWIGCELHPEVQHASPSRRASHMTSSSPLESVGRWKREMDPKTAEKFEREMGDLLRRFGYESF